MNKALLRVRLREQYKFMTEQECRAADIKIAGHLYRHPWYKNCERLFFYVGTEREIDTLPMIEAACRLGKTVALPKSYGGGVMEFYRYTGALAEGMYHIPEPVSIEMMVPGVDDLMIVPGLAFSRNGFRLGQGGGYYDRYLQQYPCLTIGLCREKFLLEEIPVLWNDLPVNCVITENGASEEAPCLV